MGCTSSKLNLASEPDYSSFDLSKSAIVSAPKRADVVSTPISHHTDTTSTFNEKSVNQSPLLRTPGTPGTHKLSNAEKVRNNALDYLDKKIEKSMVKNNDERKLSAILLGIGECGKSTVFKQMRLTYGMGFTAFEREQYAKIIWADALRAMRMLLDICDHELRVIDNSQLREVLLDWRSGEDLGMTPLDIINGVENSAIEGWECASGPVRQSTLLKFATLFDCSDIDTHSDSLGYYQSVESLAILNAVRLLQSVDMSRDAFISAEQNKNKQAFLLSHSPSVNPMDQLERANPSEVLRQILEGKNPRLDGLTNRGGAGGAGGTGSGINSFQSRGRGPTTEDGMEVLKQAGVTHTNPAMTSLYQAGAEIANYSEDEFKPKQSLDKSVDTSRMLLATAVHFLWVSCPPIIKTMINLNMLGLETNARYFLDSVGRFVDPNFEATNDDILRGRIKSVGLTSFEFDLGGSQLVVTDAGGQKSERTQWLHNFDDMSCVIYVASAASYDQMTEEDPSMSKLEEALNVFQSLVRSHWFGSKTFQLILNKIDILEEKCSRSSFSAVYPEFKGNNKNPQEILDFIERLFRQRFHPRVEGLYVYRTCATDTKTMQFVVGAVSDMILQENLRWAGMI